MLSDSICTESGYKIRLNGIEIGFIPYHESHAESKAESFQFAAMATLMEKQRQGKESRNNTVDSICTESGYKIRLNGIEIGFISHFENRAESKAESFQFAAMATLVEKQRQEKESHNVQL